MAYNNNYGGGRSYGNNNYGNGGGSRSYGNGGGRSYGNGGGYSNNGGGRSYSNNSQPRKKSGCTAGIAKSGKPYVQGWKATKTEGLTNFIAGPYESKTSSTHQTTSESGKVWENWACKVTRGTDKPYFVSAMYEVATKKLHIPELGIIMNPKGGPGGYCGKNFTPKRR